MGKAGVNKHTEVIEKELVKINKSMTVIYKHLAEMSK